MGFNHYGIRKYVFTYANGTDTKTMYEVVNNNEPVDTLLYTKQGALERALYLANNRLRDYYEQETKGDHHESLICHQKGRT